MLVRIRSAMVVLLRLAQVGTVVFAVALIMATTDGYNTAAQLATIREEATHQSATPASCRGFAAAFSNCHSSSSFSESFNLLQQNATNVKVVMLTQTYHARLASIGLGGVAVLGVSEVLLRWARRGRTWPKGVSR